MSGVGSSPALATCETSQVLLAGVSGGFPGILPFRTTYRLARLYECNNLERDIKLNQKRILQRMTCHSLLLYTVTFLNGHLKIWWTSTLTKYQGTISYVSMNNIYALLLYVHGKQVRSYREITTFFCVGLLNLSG